MEEQPSVISPYKNCSISMSSLHFLSDLYKKRSSFQTNIHLFIGRRSRLVCRGNHSSYRMAHFHLKKEHKACIGKKWRPNRPPVSFTNDQIFFRYYFVCKPSCSCFCRQNQICNLYLRSLLPQRTPSGSWHFHMSN